MMDRAIESLLLSRLSTSDPAAFEELFRYYQDRVYSYAIKICHSAPLAQEIVQDIFTTIWVNRANACNISNLGGYVRVTARNAALQHLRMRARENKAQELMGHQWSETHNETEETIIFNETLERLNQVLLKLPPQQQLIYKMCHLEGMKQQEVANQLDISPLTVKAHLRQAVQRVRSACVTQRIYPLFIVLGYLSLII